MKQALSFLSAVLLASLAAGRADEPPVVSDPAEGVSLLATAQLLQPHGRGIEFAGRPVDLALSPDGATLYAKDNRGVVVIDLGTGRIRQELAAPGGTSMHGLRVAADGTVYCSTARSTIAVYAPLADGTLEFKRAIALPRPGIGGECYPCGMRIAADGRRMWVCLSRSNALAEVDLETNAVLRTVATDLAPFDVELLDGKTAAVSCWGGPPPRPGAKTQPSAGTEVEVEAHGVARSATVVFLDLVQGAIAERVPVGLQPSQLLADKARRRLYCPCANGDEVVLLDTVSRSVERRLAARPDPALLFGSAPNAVALSADEKTLFVANGGNNGVAVWDLAGDGGAPRLAGLIPSGWYPSALLASSGPGGRSELIVASAKGIGSRSRVPSAPGWSVYNHRGTVHAFPVPAAEELGSLTERTRAHGRLPQSLAALERRESATARPRPVPRVLGEPSVFKHVVYIIKENRTYDQVFGDLPQGDGDPKLCLYGQEITPNHHALAEQFVLLDNYYCNGVNSADGHAWATEANATSYLEKSFGGFTRSYPFGDDPLTLSQTGYLWDHVLRHGLTFRNYGEFDNAEPAGDKKSFQEIYTDFLGPRTITFRQSIGVERLRHYTCPSFPGWNMNIPDVLRAEAFLKELRDFEKQGAFPNLVIITLPQDHTSGTSPGMPTPQAHVADNDLALGRIVEALSRSRFWKEMVIFINEDDPQNGFDHVDGHRSLCLVVSPYTKRGHVSHNFYNQTSVLHTLERILGVPPMTQFDAMAPLMTDLFTEEADFRPYAALPVAQRLDELNPKLAELRGEARRFAELSLRQRFDVVDGANDVELNRILWHQARGDGVPYPAALSGAHGTGLGARRLLLVPEGEDDDD